MRGRLGWLLGCGCCYGTFIRAHGAEVGCSWASHCDGVNWLVLCDLYVKSCLDVLVFSQTGDQTINKSNKALDCLGCCCLGQPVSTWQVENGWPDIHWLAGDLGGLVAANLSLA
jgi:hypothetical protein